MNRICRGSAFATSPIAASVTIALACAGVTPALAGAKIGFSVGATAGVEYNSNTLNRGRTEEPPGPDGADRGDFSRRASLDFRFNVGLDEANSGPFRVQVRASLVDASFNHFDTISHRDHDVGVIVDWRPSQAFDMSVDTSHISDPVEIADVGGNGNTQRTTFRNTATLRVRPTPSWQIGLTPGWSKSNTDLPYAPDFQLREDSGRVALDFLGAGRLMPGVAVTQTKGRYSGIDDATRYRDQSVQATLNYVATAASTFSLAAGRTHRNTRLIEPSTRPAALALEGGDSAFTGSLSFHRQLTVKTSLNLAAFRDFQQYDAGANTLVGTGFRAGINWAATSKVSTSFDTAFVFSNVEGFQIAYPFIHRKDLTRDYSLSVSYRVLQRVTLRSYVTRHIRSSTLGSAQFNNTIAGVELATTLFD